MHRMRSGDETILVSTVNIVGTKNVLLLISVAGEKCTVHIFTVGAGYTLCLGVPFKRETSYKEGGMNVLLVLPSRTLQNTCFPLM